MDRNSNPATSGRMPDNLRESLQSVAKRQRTVRLSLAVLQVLFGSLAVGLAAVLLLGEFTHMPLALRWGLALLVWVVLAELCRQVLLPSLRKVNVQAAASTMDAAIPQSQELFLSAVEFAQKPQDQFLGSPQLVRHVINRAADDAHAVDPEQAVSANNLIRWACLCAPLLLTWTILWPLMPQTLALGMQRTVFPWIAASAPRASGPGPAIMVAPGPAITYFEKHYIFPAYTRLPEKIVRDHNGSIRGLSGSRVQIIFHTTEPLAVGSRVVVNPGAGPPETQPLTPYGPLAYQANLMLIHDGTYTAVLVNQHGVKMIGKRVWPVTVDAVPPPMIHILAPALTVRVRPDDHVPVQFTATDRYGISAIRALLWTGSSAAQTVDIGLSSMPGKVIQSSWVISVPRQLGRAGGTAGHTIFYRLEALDSAQPQAHIALTARHELIVDAHLRHGYQTRQDNQLWMSLRQSIMKALIAVKAGLTQARNLARWPAYRAVDPLRQAAVAGAAVRVVRTGRALVQQAKTLLATDFGAVAARAIDVAHGPMRVAAEDLARTGLAADQSRRAQMPQFARTSMVALKRAQAALLRLLHALDQAKVHAALKNLLARLAHRQRTIARTLSANGPSPSAYHDQQSLARQLRQLLRRHPTLQDPVANQTAEQISQLAHKVASILAQQVAATTDLHPNLLRQARRTALEHLASQQQLLDRQITQFQQRYKPEIAAAAAQPVTAAMLRTVSRALENLGDAAVAREGRNNIVKTLQSMANQLDRYANQANTPRAKQQSSQAKLDQASVNQLSRQVQAASAALQQGDSAQSLQRAVRAAEAIRQQTRNMLNENPTGQERTNLLQARADANQAVEQATHQSGDAGESLLKQAYHQLANATQDQAEHLETQRSLAEQATAAALRARALANRQAELAARTAAARQTPTPQAVESLQRQITHDIAQAIAQGKNTQQNALAGGPTIAQSLKAALTEMRRAYATEDQAAAAQSTHDQTGAQVHQSRALAQMRTAGQEIAALEHKWGMGSPPAHPDGADGGKAGQAAARQAESAQTGQSVEPAGQSGTGTPSADAGQSHASQPSSGTMAAVARHVQSAVAGQPQALAGDAGAADAAAQSLTLASATLAGELAGPPSAMTSENDGKPGPGSPQPGHTASGSEPGSAGTGISGPMPDTPMVPPRVKAFGISPAEWEHLGPLQQLRLLNIARQKLPSGYRRIIRNYYLRIADLPPVPAPAQ